MLLIYIILFFTLFVAIYFLLTFYSNVDKLASRISDKEPKISIVIPAYNEEKNIAKTLDWVLNIDYPKNKLEIIVVDDGSIDRTREIAMRYASKGVKVLHKENEGCKAYAANYGIKHAHGGFIWILDADCRPEKDVLRKSLSYFDDEEVMCVVPAVKVWYPKGFWQRVQVIEYAIAIFMRKTLHFMNSQVYANASPIVRREFFEKHGNFEPGVAEDLELGMRVHAKGYKLAHVIDTAVYAEVPNKFIALSRQRIRWMYGLYENVSKHRGLFSFRYGEVGLFYMPIALGYAILPIYMMFRALLGMFKYGSEGASVFIGTNLDVGYTVAEIGNTAIPYKFVYFLVAVLIGLGIIVYLTAKKYGRIKKWFSFEYVFYAVIYLWVLGAYDLIALVLYLRKRAPRWRASMPKRNVMRRPSFRGKI